MKLTLSIDWGIRRWRKKKKTYFKRVRAVELRLLFINSVEFEVVYRKNRKCDGKIYSGISHLLSEGNLTIRIFGFDKIKYQLSTKSI